MSPAGRPPVGPQIMIRIPIDLLAEIDHRAQRAGVTRAAIIRQLLTQAIEQDPQ